MSLFLPPSVRHFTPKRVAFSTWIDHLPFGYDLVHALRPKMLVELGTQNGASFFSFCQSMAENEIDGLAYAVDTWEGEKHTGAYDESVYEDVAGHARKHYPGISYLLRMLFNDALQHFSEESIDLLHIDGLHTYDAVSEDLTNWYPKVRPGGVILFHDIHARIQDFGVWTFWEETRDNYNTFEFKQGFGLGVLRKEGGEPLTDPLLKLLFESSPEEQETLRAFYVHAAKHLDLKRKVDRQERMAQKAKQKQQQPKPA